MKLHLTAMGCHLPDGITVLPSTRHKWTHPAVTPATQAGAQFANLVGMEGWVDLDDRLRTKMVCLATDGHPSRC